MLAKSKEFTTKATVIFKYSAKIYYQCLYPNGKINTFDYTFWYNTIRYNTHQYKILK